LQILVWAAIFLINFFSLLPMDGLLQSIAYTILNTFFYAVIIYGNINFLFPRLYLRKKIGLYIIVSLLLLAAIGVLKAYIAQVVYNAWFSTKYYPFELKSIIYVTVGTAVVFILSFVFRIALAYFVLKQQAQQMLEQKSLVELNLLKSQVQPHFLFNTLNNVYAHAQVGSSSAPVLIAGLSDLLRYMLYECDLPLVPFDKELKMVQDYVLLERVRYDNKLDVNVQLSGDTRGAYIAPLLLLPFIENCFKHGTSQMLEQPWVSLQIVLEDDWMKMKLLNGKAPDVFPSSGGIGIANVVKRLEYLYPGKHQLVINNEEDVFIVNLKLQIERRPVMESGAKMSYNNKIHELAQP